MAKDYGLLIAALVAIVAIVGLVILFGANQTGAAVDPGRTYCAPGYEVAGFVGAAGKLSYVQCVKGEYPGIPNSLWQ